ncbi:hypothetical protein SAMN05444007_103150 [Cribrihabitans marinus]|jgi:hypothetical protein|uniref:Uncharacterized protein n=1 Tax=Cribrihabitans marinus TaxID=1227549 RepID=A0A1H6VC92_9RHOB|nr:hypothetical protein [Cribrihabitans marinus]GGH25973.1 hypothetical protein GCM10010973_13470 [Cribrihabitans marinus]SEJ02203.1 hypothetical protein SAMN05444007_103150 [Cribrihabitans marinus]
MEILGRDSWLESYRIAVEVDGVRVIAHVPERLFADRPGQRPSHQAAYEGIAARKAAIETSIADLVRGRPLRAPYDQILLAEDN